MSIRWMLSRHLRVSLLVCSGSLAACSAGSDGGLVPVSTGGDAGDGGASGSHAGSSGSSTGGTSGASAAGGADTTGGTSGTSSNGAAGTSTGGSDNAGGSAGSTTGASGSAGNAGSAGSTTGTAGSTSGVAGATSGSSGAGGIGGDQSFGGAAQGPGPGVGGDAGSSGSASGTAGTMVVCNEGASTTDDDGDGYTEEQGDCRDCDPTVRPGAINATNYVTCTAGSSADCVCDASNNCKAPAPADLQFDESCGHTAPASCGAGLPLDGATAVQGANAIDICGGLLGAGDPSYGLLNAKWVRANGANATVNKQIGIMSTFGTNVVPQLGENMLVLSSGHARTPGQNGACGSESCTTSSGTPPSGFPQDVPNCDGSSSINDDIGLEIQLRAPTNATGFKFRFKFQSFEYAEWVCSSYNDQFIALMNPPPPGAINGNISFDANTNPVSVNIAFFDVCDPNGLGTFAEECFSSNCPSPPNPYCPSGASQLAGTGFDSWGDAGATSWLVTQAPVTGGEVFTLRFAIWDTGDQALDSTVLIDGFEWIADGSTISVGTGKEDP